MADNDNGPSAAATNPFSSGGEGGEMASKMAHQYSGRVARYVLRKLAGVRLVKRFLENTDDATIDGLYDALPGVGGFIDAKLVPDRITGKKWLDEFIHGIILESFERASEVIKEAHEVGEEVEEEDLADIVNEIFEKLAQRKVYLYGGHFHLEGCPVIEARRGIRQLSFIEAVEQDIAACAHCQHRAEALLSEMLNAREQQQQPTQPKPPKKFKSHADMMGWLARHEPELVQEYKEFRSRQSPAKRKKLNVVMEQVDTPSEFIWFMTLDERDRVEALSVFENRSLLTFIRRGGREIKKEGKKGLVWIDENLSAPAAKFLQDHLAEAKRKEAQAARTRTVRKAKPAQRTRKPTQGQPTRPKRKPKSDDDITFWRFLRELFLP